MFTIRRMMTPATSIGSCRPSPPYLQTRFVRSDSGRSAALPLAWALDGLLRLRGLRTYPRPYGPPSCPSVALRADGGEDSAVVAYAPVGKSTRIKGRAR